MILAQALPHACEDRPALAAREVHLWWITPEPGDGAVAAAWAAVSAAERERAQLMQAEIERDRFLLRHQALRAILGRYAGVRPHELEFTVGPFGKPTLTQPQSGAGLSFNLSRSGGAAVLALARSGRLGVDVERLRPVPEIDAIARRLFSPAEAQALAAMRDDNRSASFFRLWTRKEAVVKALGGGLSIALDAFGVGHRADEPPALTRWQLDSRMRGTLRLLPVQQVSGHMIALAADAPADVCRLLRWPGNAVQLEVPPSTERICPCLTGTYSGIGVRGAAYNLI